MRKGKQCKQQRRGVFLRHNTRVAEPLPPQPGRPRTRADCHPDAGLPNSARPCPWVGCRYHLLLNVRPETGSLSLPPHETIEQAFDDMPQTCALDVADEGPLTAEEIGNLFFSTRQSILDALSIVRAKMRYALGGWE